MLSPEARRIIKKIREKYKDSLTKKPTFKSDEEVIEFAIMNLDLNRRWRDPWESSGQSQEKALFGHGWICRTHLRYAVGSQDVPFCLRSLDGHQGCLQSSFGVQPTLLCALGLGIVQPQPGQSGARSPAEQVFQGPWYWSGHPGCGHRCLGLIARWVGWLLRLVIGLADPALKLPARRLLWWWPGRLWARGASPVVLVRTPSRRRPLHSLLSGVRWPAPECLDGLWNTWHIQLTCVPLKTHCLSVQSKHTVFLVRILGGKSRRFWGGQYSRVSVQLGSVGGGSLLPSLGLFRAHGLPSLALGGGDLFLR